METPAKRQGFNLPAVPLNFTPPPGTPFNDAIIKVGEEWYMKVVWAKSWVELLPCPAEPFPPTPLEIAARMYSNKPARSEREQRLEWQVKARGFFDSCKTIIDNKQGQLLYYFGQGLEQWKKRGRGISLTPEQILSRWQAKHSGLSMVEFARLCITSKSTTLVFKEIAEMQEADYGFPNKSLASTYGTFTDLFIDPADIKTWVDALNSYEKASSKSGFVKSVVVAWIDHLHGIKKIHTNAFESVAPVLIREFPGFTISRRTFYEKTTVGENAKVYFKVNFPH